MVHLSTPRKEMYSFYFVYIYYSFLCQLIYMYIFLSAHNIAKDYHLWSDTLDKVIMTDTKLMKVIILLMDSFCNDGYVYYEYVICYACGNSNEKENLSKEYIPETNIGILL